MTTSSHVRVLLLFSLLTTLVANCESSAAIIIDQTGGGPNLIAAVSASSEYQQEVTAGVSGQFIGLDLWSWGLGSNTNPIIVGINLGTGWQTDAADISRTFVPTASNQRMFVDFSATPFFLNAGDKFLITLDGVSSSSGWVAYGNNDYPGNSFFLNNVELVSNDLHFQTHMNVSTAVPEPASLAFLAMAAATIAFRRRARREIL